MSTTRPTTSGAVATGRWWSSKTCPNRTADSDDVTTVLGMLASHVRFTGSTVAAGLLTDWDTAKERFVKVIPKDYKRVLLAEARARAESREPAFNELVGVVVNG